jgi:hypothetical protein
LIGSFVGALKISHFQGSLLKLRATAPKSRALTPSVRVLVGLRLMRRMHMLMAAMLVGMPMVMHMGVFCMSMLVGMLVQMLMGVRVRMLMQMDNFLMLVLMAVCMGMLMRM